jgi:hypothetical protein
MAKKNSSNGLYWQNYLHRLIKDEYTQFLRQEGFERNPESAQIFATRKRNDGYSKMSERDIILLVAGELPCMYD